MPFISSSRVLTEGDAEVEDEAPSEHLEVHDQLIVAKLPTRDLVKAWQPEKVWKSLTPVIGLIAIAFVSRTLRQGSVMWVMLGLKR